ncbi:MAG TPA: CPBP family intramembrane metalloprotease [Bacteroidales bacterium]|nr:CPBP family intramembrane metalloprotease [Bacteroidales bacterium]
MIFQPFLHEKPPYLKLLYYILITGCSLILVTMIGMALAVPFFGKSFIESLTEVRNYSDPAVIAKLKYMQIVSQLALFVVPVLIFAMFAGKSIPDYLKLNRKINLLPVLIAISIIFAGLPFINWLTEINGNMSFPEQFSGIEKWMRDSEADAGALTKVFLNSTTIGGLLINILMIAILPAIGEEFFFRGVLQRLFSEWFKNVHVAIIVTAIIFSAFHMQFYGFIPRLLLGMFLGYLFYWSGSLWLPIIIHFLNNGMAVIVAFLAARGTISTSFETFGSSDNLFVNISSVIVVSGLMFLLYKTRPYKTRRINS